MSKKVLIIVLIMSVGLAKSQVWCTKASTWYFSHWNIWSGQGYIKFTYLNDTLIGGKQCNRINRMMVAQSAQSNYDFYTHVDNKVVYLYNTFQNKFDTLYNFGANIGDTWRQCSPGNVTVSDTGSRVIQNVRLKWLRVNYTSPIGPVNKWDTIYERFGAMGCFPYDPTNICMKMVDGESGGMMRCFSDNQIINYKGTYTNNCDSYPGPMVWASVSNVSSADIRIYPNPCQEFLKIEGEIDVGDLNIELIDSFGRGLKNLRCDQNREIDTSKLPPGMYILRAIEKQKIVYILKVFKQR